MTNALKGALKVLDKESTTAWSEVQLLVESVESLTEALPLHSLHSFKAIKEWNKLPESLKTPVMSK